MRKFRFAILICFCLYMPGCLLAQEIPLVFKATAHASPDTICQGQFTQLSVTIQGGPGPFTYLWSPASTLSNPAIPNPVATPLTNTRYKVLVTDQWQSTSTDSVMVYVQTIPQPPSAISGPSHVCSDTVCQYSVDTVPGISSYSWTVPSGASILSGQNTPVLIMTWGRNSGTVSVIEANACGPSIPSVLTVSVSSVPPAPTGIEGPGHLCQSDTGYFHTDSIVGALDYKWTVPPECVILSGKGTTSVRVRWGDVSGTVSVAGQNLCGYGETFVKPVTLDSMPGAAGPVNGPDTVCLGQSGYNYFITALNHATSYGWSLPEGAVITSGMHTSRITVEFGNNSQSGPVMAYGINSCGNGQASEKQLVVRNCSGIEETGIPLFSVSPNPAGERIVIDLRTISGTCSVMIFDRLGRTVFRQTIFSAGPGTLFEIPTSSLPQGLLFLSVSSAGRSGTVKIVIL